MVRSNFSSSFNVYARKKASTSMRKTIFEVAVAVAAAAIVLLVAAVSGSLHGTPRWLLVAGVALIACGTAWLAARRILPAQVPGVEVGNRIRSNENVNVRDISVEPTTENISIANDIRSKRSTRLHGITVRNTRRPSK